VSTAGLFRASRPDGRSDWRVVFDLVDGRDPGYEVGHDAILEALGTDNRSRMYRAVQRANHELWKTRNRSLAVVKGVGYRVLHAEEHVPLANSYRRQARKRMTNAVSVMEATDLDALGPEARKFAVEVTGAFRAMTEALGAVAARVARHDDLIRSVQNANADLQKRVGKLERERHDSP
jgi:hypothetical protein